MSPVRAHGPLLSTLLLCAAATAGCSREPCRASDEVAVVSIQDALETCNHRPTVTIEPPSRNAQGELVFRATAADRDGDALGYRWEVEAPVGLGATIEALPSGHEAILRAQDEGTYLVAVSVSDGDLWSERVTREYAVRNEPPVARAGPDFGVPLGESAQLDGSGSRDPEGATLTYSWTLIESPVTSLATLRDPTSATPSITCDVEGRYVVQLIVSDGLRSSAPDTVLIGGGVAGAPPTADAGADLQVTLGGFAALNGAASFDPDGDALTYRWDMIASPDGQVLALQDADTPLASFRPTAAGSYTVRLTVDDGFFSAQDEAHVHVMEGGMNFAPRPITESTETYVGLFATPEGLLLVDSKQVRLVDLDGNVLASFTAPGEITSAAYDGRYFVVAERARWHLVDTVSLVPVRDGLLTNYCYDSVLVGDGVFVCAPETTWDRVYESFDVLTGQRLARSRPITYRGRALRRIPGHDAFVATSVGSSPTDHFLYEVAPDGEVHYVNESPYHGDYVMTGWLAFDADGERMIDVDGGIFEIRGGPTCAGAPAYPSECFLRQGDLGQLPVQRYYKATTDDGRGTFFGLYDGVPWRFDPFCEALIGCVVHVISIAEQRMIREVRLEAPDGFVWGSPIDLVFDPFRQRLIVVTVTDRFEPVGYRVRGIAL